MCKHGSPDPRDELAHLDAHRQLGRFLQEWDAAVVSDREHERRRRPRAVMASALSVVVALVVGAMVWGLAFNADPPHRGVAPVPGSTRPRTQPELAPTAALPPVTAAPAPQPDAVLPPQGSPQPPALSAVAPTASVARNPAAGVPAPAPSTVSAPDAPAAAPPASPVSALEPVITRAAPLPPTYLARVCLLGTCLTVG